MIIAVSGYNATGKSTVASNLKESLESRGISVKVKRFAALYPGTYLGKKKQKRNPKVSSEGNVGLRAIEGQRGSWNQSLGWSTFANIVAASLAAHWLAFANRRSIVIFDRFLYDRCIHFAKDSWKMKLAQRVFFRPTVTLVLLPSLQAHEQRFLERIERRHGIKLDQMSKSDKSELAMVHDRYAQLVDEFTECVLIDTSDPRSVETACKIVSQRLPSHFARSEPA